jgi:hypothetical protein
MTAQDPGDNLQPFPEWRVYERQVDVLIDAR